MSRHPLSVLVLLLVLASACGRPAAVEPAAGSPPPTPTTPSGAPGLGPPPGPTSGVVVEITRADDRTTVAAHVGDVLQISLGTEYDWQLDPPDGTVLTHPVQTYLLREGVQAIWLASSVGRSTITAKGEARCSAGQPCQAAAFTATVEVLP